LNLRSSPQSTAATRSPNSRRSSTTARATSRAVADLVDKGLVYTERDGRRKRVVPSDARAVELYQDLVRQHSHIEFPELLTGKAIEVLYYLDQPRTVAEMADRSDNYRNTVNRVLKRIRDRGLVGTDDGHYDFNADFNRPPRVCP